MSSESVSFDRQLLDSWMLALRAERKSPNTLHAYSQGVRTYTRWCEADGRPLAFSRRAMQEFNTHQLEDAGLEASTVFNRHVACRRFTAWLLEEGEADVDPLAGMKGPKMDQKVVIPYTEEQLAALFSACKGTDLMARRDEAIARFMAESGTRASETVDMLVSETHVAAGSAVIRRGKGGKGRIVPFGPQTARAIDRYLRVRKTHRLAVTDVLWLGDRGKSFAYPALRKSLSRRAKQAGLPEFHPHKLRHTFADRWLDKGGSESGLMAVAGWERPEMLLRYTRGRRNARGLEEARSLNLGDL